MRKTVPRRTQNLRKRNGLVLLGLILSLGMLEALGGIPVRSKIDKGSDQQLLQEVQDEVKEKIDSLTDDQLVKSQ
ncbi:MAG TPA: hypothetical protein PKA00_08610 [Saprospiraceae bacterium]|nr:hypothetical protein [Saprospiraceae bacterium]HMQ82956.1 hypothetical protein [Saprospiraceae bacterium]